MDGGTQSLLLGMRLSPAKSPPSGESTSPAINPPKRNFQAEEQGDYPFDVTIAPLMGVECVQHGGFAPCDNNQKYDQEDKMRNRNLWVQVVLVVSWSIMIANNIGAVTPPTGSLADTKIAFVSDRDGNHEIYMMNADGTNPVNRTNHLAMDRSPSWSPDGTKIAFQSSRDGNDEIYVMNPDGTNQIRLTHNTVDDYTPRWSPDGTKIVFAPLYDGLYVMNPEGSNPTRLTNPAQDFFPSWSPDGTKIIFASTRNGNQAEIYMINADGTNLINLTNHPADDFDPSWSPDGTKITFVSIRDLNEEIYVMNADGTNPVRLTSHPATDRYPYWSPDGTKIAFASNRNGNYEIYVMDTNGSNPVNLTNHPAGDFLPAWSPFLLQAPQITTPSLPNGSVGESYSQTLQATGGTPPYSWSITSGNLPNGFSLNPSSGVISGTPTAGGVFNFTVEVRDSAGQTATKDFAITINAPPTLAIISPTSGQAFPAGTTSISLQVDIANHPSPGHWHWQLDTPFPTSGPAGGNMVTSGNTATITGLMDGRTYTVYATLVDGDHNVLSPPVTANVMFSVENLPIDPLLIQYEPTLYFYENERYRPMRVDEYVDHCEFWSTDFDFLSIEWDTLVHTETTLSLLFFEEYIKQGGLSKFQLIV